MCCHLYVQHLLNEKKFQNSTYPLCLQAIWWEEACWFQSHARPQWVPDPGVKRAVPSSRDFLLATTGTWIHLQWFWGRRQGSGSRTECWSSHVLPSGPVPELDPMGPRGFTCLFLGEVSILIHWNKYFYKKGGGGEDVNVGGSLLQEEYEVSGVSRLAINLFVLTASKWSILLTALLPCLHRSLQPMQDLHGWGWMWCWNGMAPITFCILCRNSQFCHYEHFV